jgi:hypothetical protein
MELHDELTFLDSEHLATARYSSLVSSTCFEVQLAHYLVTGGLVNHCLRKMYPLVTSKRERERSRRVRFSLVAITFELASRLVLCHSLIVG